MRWALLAVLTAATVATWLLEPVFGAVATVGLGFVVAAVVLHNR